MVTEIRNKVLIVSYRHTDFLYRQLKDILVTFGGIQVGTVLSHAAKKILSDHYIWLLYFPGRGAVAEEP